MQKFIACLVLVTLLGMMSPLLSAQQNQNAQKSDAEIEAFEKRVSELEKQLQTVENIEKLDLQAKLAEANAKLANAEFGKFERELRDSSNGWLRGWSSWFLGVIGVCVAILIGVGAVFWFWLRSTANKWIADTVEKNLNGFKTAVKAQDVIKNQLGMLEKQYVASVLADVIDYDILDERHHPQPIKALREETLLQVFNDDKTYFPMHIFKAAEVLAARKSQSVISPLLDRLNLAANSDINPPFDRFNITPTPNWPDAVQFLEHMQTPEAYEGLKEFLNHLLTEELTGANWFVGKTVSSLVQVGFKLNMRDSVSILRMAIPNLNESHIERESLCELAMYFDIFNEPAGIKEILIHVTSKSSGMEDVEEGCLELLQKHDPQYVADWRARKKTDNSET